MVMQAGKLRHRITLQLLQQVKDDFGQVGDVYHDWATVWADVIPLRGREVLEQKKEGTNYSHKVEMRYKAGVMETMKVIHPGSCCAFGDLEMDVITVINVDGRNRELNLMCEQVKT